MNILKVNWMKLRSFVGLKTTRILAVLFVLLTPKPLFAQSAEVYDGQDFMFYMLVSAIFLVMVLVLMVSVYTLNVLKLIMRRDQEAAGKVEPKRESWWRKFNASVTDAVPIEEEDTVLLSHSYDGIQELDNHLPPWWKWLFYFTIVFGIGYIAVYHFWKSAPLQHEAFVQELQEAEEQKKMLAASNPDQVISVDNITFSDDPQVLSKGAEIFSGICQSCHGSNAGGIASLGPNLTDEYWLHGGDVQSIYNTISEGSPNLRMISFKNQYSPANIRAVTSYIMSLQGSNPEGGLEPEGERYVPGESTAEADSVVAE